MVVATAAREPEAEGSPVQGLHGLWSQKIIIETGAEAATQLPSSGPGFDALTPQTTNTNPTIKQDGCSYLVLFCTRVLYELGFVPCHRETDGADHPFL